MCFSAAASFGLSAVLLPSGAYCVWSAFAKRKVLLGLAIIPLVFGAQQFFEGLVWRGLDQDNIPCARMAAFAYLYFALAFWPLWGPLCAFLTESNIPKKRLLACFTFLGFVGGLVLYLAVALNPEVLNVEVRNHSIFYDITQSPAYHLMPQDYWQVLYVIIVGVPLLIAPARGFVLLGIAIVASALITHIFYWYAFVSVWCFFAAILSLYLCFSFQRLQSPGPGV
jgi:hypothetical protein